MIRVVRPGFLSTVQDTGRWGYQRFGVPVAGPMDIGAHRLANLIVGNLTSAATIEVTIVGPILEFEKKTTFAVAGAKFDLFCDGVLLNLNTSYVGSPGQQLVFKSLREGARSYISVAGGFDVPLVFGSRATHVCTSIGGFNGRALACGDQLSIGSDFKKKAVAGVVRPNVVALPQHGARVRIIPGPNDGDLGVGGLKRLCSTRYVINPKSDRMGYRLDGDSRFSNIFCEHISTAVPIGAVQVLPRGEPIILMADHQTTGGYPHVATVITADLGTVGQLVPGDWIKFDLCDYDVAIDALIKQERMMMS